MTLAAQNTATPCASDHISLHADALTIRKYHVSRTTVAKIRCAYDLVTLASLYASAALQSKAHGAGALSRLGVVHLITWTCCAETVYHKCVRQTHTGYATSTL